MQKVFLLLLFLSGIQGLCAQPGDIAADPALPLRVSLLNENTGMPFNSTSFERLNPGASIGTEISYMRKQYISLFQSADLSFYDHRKLGTAFMLSSQLGIRPRYKRFQAELKAGPGYMLHYSYTHLYRYNNSEYSKTSQLQHKLILSAGISFGYRFGNITPFLGWNVMIQTPFLTSSALLPHQLFEAGVLIQIPCNKRHE
jgi:hypothetical protein